ncbi:hypothetical protein DFH09DRAFT_1088911 [Mycena vulgaris]|nr:hypothetical protein DFH09DRAFT_1088911 [Mycena vulgaris]
MARPPRCILESCGRGLLTCPQLAKYTVAHPFYTPERWLLHDIAAGGCGKAQPRSLAQDILATDAFQSLYHVVRMELGVIHENQIYASSEMYNRTIASVNIRGFTPGTVTPLVNTSALATDADLLSQWVEAVRMFNSTDRVPVMFYLRPVPRLKPLGSAITSVFVSTFAMLSTLWTIFNIIAAALAKAKAKTGDLAETPDDETIFYSGARMGRRLRDKLGGPDGKTMMVYH